MPYAQHNSHARARRNTTRAAYTLGALCWPAAGAVWYLHVSGHVFTNPSTCALAFTWLVAAGCLGVPVAGVRLLGRWMTAGACRALSLISLSVSALLSVLYLDGQLHPTVASLYASLIMPMAVGIHAHNANQALAKECDAYRRGKRGADYLETQSDEEIAATIQALQDLLAGRQAVRGAQQQPPQQRAVHLVRSDERRHAGDG